jgi:hypothetical protein
LEFNTHPIVGRTQNGIGSLHFGLVEQFFLQGVSFQIRMEGAWKNQLTRRTQFNFSSQCRSGTGAFSSWGIGLSGPRTKIIESLIATMYSQPALAAIARWHCFACFSFFVIAFFQF